MTHDELIAFIDEADDDTFLAMEPRDFFDQFIVGIVERFHDTFVVYDKAAMIEAMAKDWSGAGDIEEGDDPETVVLEHYEFNMRGGWVGENTWGFLAEHADRSVPDQT